MTIQSRAFGVSLAIHACAFILIAAAGIITPRSKAVVLDFSLGNSPNAGQQQAAPVKRQTPAAQKQKTVTPTVQDEQAAPIPKTPAAEEPAKPVSEELKTAKEESAGAGAGALSPGSAEEAKGRYLGAHFIFIRDKIFKNLTYPPLARKMGWAGRVTVAFTVCTDGRVEDISIVESSGFAALDRSAVEAVKRSCPLPRPPMKTALIMPVVYRLD